MTFETRKRILGVMEFPISIGDVRIAIRMRHETAQENLEWLFSMGILHSSRDPKNGMLLYHKKEFKHPTMLSHLSIEEIEERKKQGLLKESEGRKEAELKDIEEREKKMLSDHERQSLEDVPVEKYPEDEENFQSEIKIEED